MKKAISFIDPIKQSVFVLVASILGLVSCQQNNDQSQQKAQGSEVADPKVEQARKIVASAIEVHGGEAYEHFSLAFDFRDIHYKGERHNGLYRYERFFSSDSLGAVQDVLTNDGFTRFIDGKEATISAERATAFSNSVNAVFYFMLLPYPLNDPAVNMVLDGEEELKGEPYYRVKVWFNEEGGGQDHEDIFCYWFHQEHFTMDYLGYSYLTEGGGVRFREAFNTRVQGGVRFADYINYKPADKTTPVETLGSLYSQGQLEILSRIENTNISLGHNKVAF